MELIEFKESEKLLKKYKIPCARAILVLDKKEALAVAKKISYPVFLKIYGKNILHRIDIGGIKKVENKKELEKEFLRMSKIKGIDGIIVQEKVEGKEIIVGMKRDPQFGPTIIVGAGGIFTEALGDFVLRVCPIDENDAMNMMQELKAWPYLSGRRDNKPINFEAVVKIITAVSQLSVQEDVQELTFNPIIANNKKAVVVDFKILK